MICAVRIRGQGRNSQQERRTAWMRRRSSRQATSQPSRTPRHRAGQGVPCVRHAGGCGGCCCLPDPTSSRRVIAGRLSRDVHSRRRRGELCMAVPTAMSSDLVNLRASLYGHARLERCRRASQTWACLLARFGTATETSPTVQACLTVPIRWKSMPVDRRHPARAPAQRGARPAPAERRAVAGYRVAQAGGVAVRGGESCHEMVMPLPLPARQVQAG